MAEVGEIAESRDGTLFAGIDGARGRFLLWVYDTKLPGYRLRKPISRSEAQLIHPYWGRNNRLLDCDPDFGNVDRSKELWRERAKR
jgi:hypothetical protein